MFVLAETQKRPKETLLEEKKKRKQLRSYSIVFQKSQVNEHVYMIIKNRVITYFNE